MKYLISWTALSVLIFGVFMGAILTDKDVVGFWAKVSIVIPIVTLMGFPYLAGTEYHKWKEETDG